MQYKPNSNRSIDVHDLFHYVGIWCIDGAKYDVVDPKLPKFAWVGYCFGDAVSAKKRKMKEDIGAVLLIFFLFLFF